MFNRILLQITVQMSRCVVNAVIIKHVKPSVCSTNVPRGVQPLSDCKNLFRISGTLRISWCRWTGGYQVFVCWTMFILNPRLFGFIYDKWSKLKHTGGTLSSSLLPDRWKGWGSGTYPKPWATGRLPPLRASSSVPHRLFLEALKPQLVFYRMAASLCEKPWDRLVYLHVYIYYPVESIWVWMLCNGWACRRWRKRTFCGHFI